MANSISRLEKLENISGEKYPRDFPGRETISHVLWYATQNHYANLSGNYEDGNTYKIAGRISARRGHKDNIFFDIFDQTGSIQLHAKRGAKYYLATTELDILNLEFWTKVEECDIGDMVGVEGTLGISRDGEPLLLISNFITLAKALKDPPANFHGVKNPETRFRHREQDLLSSAETRELFKTRAKIVFEIRKYLNERDFVEIECPVLQPIYGGATARPFKTNHNALGQDFFLSISSELYLKRAMVGGFDRVYSFSRCFRNEGISPTHNPEFTNLEIFETCKTADDIEFLTKDLLNYLFTKYKILDILNIYSSAVLYDDWPLSRRSLNNPNLADAWELYSVNSEKEQMEIASGASDLNDPREQEARLKESENNAKENFTHPPDYDPYDQNYIEALECGALPWAGVGIGIDRLVMLLTEKTNIRDVLMFPLLKSEK